MWIISFAGPDAGVSPATAQAGLMQFDGSEVVPAVGLAAPWVSHLSIPEPVARQTVAAVPFQCKDTKTSLKLGEDLPLCLVFPGILFQTVSPSQH